MKKRNSRVTKLTHCATAGSPSKRGDKKIMFFAIDAL